MKLTISPFATIAILAVAGLVLAVAGVVAEVGALSHGEDWAFGLIALVGLDYEGNLPSWYLSMLLLLAAGLAGLIARTAFPDRAKHRRHWAVLGLVLLAASVAATSDADITVLQPVWALIAQAVNPDKVALALAFCAAVACAALSIGFMRAQARNIQVLAACAGAHYLAVPLLRDHLTAMWYRLGATEAYEPLRLALLPVAETAFDTFATVLLIAALMIRLFGKQAELRIVVEPAAAARSAM